MTDTDTLVAALLDSCSEQVLETMFFSAVLDHADPTESSGQSRVAARLHFRGIPSGDFEVDADAQAVRALAAGFLGLDETEVTGDQEDEVLAEFTNMACGSALSSLGRVEYFNLDKPETSRSDSFAPAIDGVRRAFVLDRGTLGVCLKVDFSRST